MIRGNHHDAWVNGAQDPTSGQVALLEEARAIGEMMKQGWRPKRTLIYCSWDAEEPMLLGSTEWVEEHDKELAQHAVAYINSDGNGRGYLEVEGSHTLEHLVNDVARDIQDPETKLAVSRRAQMRQISKPGRKTIARNCGSAPTCGSRRSAQAPTTRRSSITLASRP